jgi:hypothetical protein
MTASHPGKDRPDPWDFLLYGCLVAEIALILCLLFIGRGEGIAPLMELESPALASSLAAGEIAPLARGEILDTVMFMSGTSLEMGGDAGGPGSLPDEGHAYWILVDDRAGEEDGLLKAVRRGLGQRQYGDFCHRVQGDGVLSIVFGMGESGKAFKHNWQQAEREAGRISPLLPWELRADFGVIYSFDQDNLGGIPHFTAGNPAAPILCPPLHRDALLGRSGIRAGAAPLVPLPPGYTSLTRRLGAFVYPVKLAGMAQTRYQLCLVIHLDDGLAVISPGGGIEIAPLLQELKKALPGEVLYFVGSTGLHPVSPTPDGLARMEKALALAPRIKIYSGQDSSPAAGEMWRKVLGPHYHNARAGFRVRLGGNE